MLTVGDLLAVDRLALTAVHLPSPAADVRWVATSELADPTPYLEGGEVLLTTGLETSDWRSEWAAYVERLVRAEVAAIGLGVDLTHHRSPPDLVHACERSGLNLVEVPARTAFVTISHTVAARLEAEQASLARRAMDAQRGLIQAALERDDVAAVLRRLATIVGGAVATVTRDGEIDHGPFGEAGGLPMEEVRHSLARLRSDGLRASASASTRAGTLVVLPLGVRSQPDRWLAVQAPHAGADPARTAVAAAVSLLSLSIERRREQRATRRQISAHAVELVLDGDARTARLLLRAVGATGHRPMRVPDQVRLLQARGARHDVEHALATLEDALVLAASDGDELTVVSSTRQAPGIARRLARAGIRVGVGAACPVESCAESRSTARIALDGATEAAPVRTWDDVTGSGVVGLVPARRHEAFARSYLGPLRTDPVLIPTLQAFLQTHGSRAETAALLGVHRNTVRNRLEQIERALDASLDDPQTRVDSWVALQALV